MAIQMLEKETGDSRDSNGDKEFDAHFTASVDNLLHGQSTEESTYDSLQPATKVEESQYDTLPKRSLLLS